METSLISLLFWCLRNNDYSRLRFCTLHKGVFITFDHVLDLLLNMKLSNFNTFLWLLVFLQVF